MNISRLVRSPDWWEYKLPPLLAVGYATILLENKNIFEYYSALALILLSVVIGAVYVSVINDISDIEIDRKAGKSNKMATLPIAMHWLIPAACLTAGAGFIYFFYYPDIISCIFYTMPWIAFSLYSFPPFRLKNRGIWGVLADASGSHIFTSLLMASAMYHLLGEAIDYSWLFLLGCWAFCYGIRGILWHQFHDRHNDIKSGIKTFATEKTPGSFEPTERVIFAIEVLATSGIIIKLNNAFVYAAIMVYALLVWLRYRKMGQYPLIIIEPRGHPYQILMLDFMQALFPVSLLLYASLYQSGGWIVLLIHIVLFPFKTFQILKDLKRCIV